MLLIVEHGAGLFYTKNNKVFVEYGMPWTREYDGIELLPSEKLYITRTYIIMEIDQDGTKIIVALDHRGCIYPEYARELGQKALERCSKKCENPRIVLVNNVGISCISETGERFSCD